MLSTLPSSIAKFFWGDDLSLLSWDLHSRYIIATILEKGDREAIRWLFKQADRKTILEVTDGRLDKRSKNFWQLYLS